MGNLSSNFLKSLGLAKDPIKILTFGNHLIIELKI